MGTIARVMTAALVLSVGCGDDGGSSEDAGSGGDARMLTDGAATDDGSTPDAATGCARFGFVVSGEACGSCAPVQCDCPDAFPRSLTDCTDDGCLIAADCDAVCAAPELADALACTDTYTVEVETCTDDVDCPGGSCDEGACRPWEPQWVLAGGPGLGSATAGLDLVVDETAVLTADVTERSFTGEPLTTRSDVLTFVDGEGNATSSQVLAERDAQRMQVRHYPGGDLLVAIGHAAGSSARTVSVSRLSPDGGTVRWLQESTGGGVRLDDVSLSSEGETLVAVHLNADATLAGRTLALTGTDGRALVEMDADGVGTWDAVVQGDASVSSAAYTGDRSVAWVVRGNDLTLEGETLSSSALIRLSGGGAVLDRTPLTQPALKVAGGSGTRIVLAGYSNNPVRRTELLPGLELPIGRDTWVAALDGTTPLFLTVVGQHGIDGDLDNLAPSALRVEGAHIVWAGTQRKPVTVPGIGRVTPMGTDMAVARLNVDTGALERFATFGTPGNDYGLDADLDAAGATALLGLAQGPGVIGDVTLDQADTEQTVLVLRLEP